MIHELHIPEMENLKANLNDLLDLIARANKMIAFHQSYEQPDTLAIRQYEDLKQQYAVQIIELLKEMNVSLQVAA